MRSSPSSPPLIVHVVYRFDVGGLENGVVNLINRLPASRWRHAVIALTEVSPAMQARVKRPDVEYIALAQRPRPPVSALPAAVPPVPRSCSRRSCTRATSPRSRPRCRRWLAGVPVRVHGEHGWDMHDLDGTQRPLSLGAAPVPAVRDSATSRCRGRSRLPGRAGRHRAVARSRRSTTASTPQRFHGAGCRRAPAPHCRSPATSRFVVGTVGRHGAGQGPAEPGPRVRCACSAAAQRRARRLRLVIVGDGPLRDAGAARCSTRPARGISSGWPATRDDVPDVMRGLDLLRPAVAGRGHLQHHPRGDGERRCRSIATRVGGNAELIEDGVTGTAGRRRADAEALAAVIGAISTIRGARAAARQRRPQPRRGALQPRRDGARPTTSVYAALLRSAAPARRRSAVARAGGH